METLLHTIVQLSKCKDLAAIIECIKPATRKLAQADGVTFILTQDDHCLYLDEDAIAPMWKGQTFPDSNCIAGWAINHKQNVSIYDVAKDERILQDVYEGTFVKSLLIVPVGDEPTAAIGVYWSEYFSPSQEIIEKLQALASSVCVTMENVELYEKLNQKVLAQTAAYQKALLVAEDANRAKSKYLAYVSHDLRQPLQQILHLNNILQKNLSDEAALKHLGRTQTILAGMKTLLDKILDLEQVENGNIEVINKGFDLSDSFKELALSFQQECDSKNIALNIDTKKHMVRTDEALLMQILRNILSNAVKYTQKGSITVSSQHNDGVLEIGINDTGPGISSSEQLNIFKPFYQINDERKNKDSHGLGLTMVKELCDTLAINIKVESINQVGTTFTLFVPSVNEIEAQEDLSPALIETDTTSEATILYLEDNAIMAESVSTLLSMEGYKVLVADCKKQALDLLQAPILPIDLIVTDNRLRFDENGLELVDSIRALVNKYVPAIMVTGHSEKTFELAALKTVQKVLLKPIDADDLISEIAYALKQTEVV